MSLCEIQAERRENEGRDRRCAAALMEYDEEKGITGKPAQDGFVFSNAEIETDSQREQRFKKASATESFQDSRLA